MQRWLIIITIIFIFCMTCEYSNAMNTTHNYIIENKRLKASVDADSGTISVLDKRCGYEWHQQKDALNSRIVTGSFMNIKQTDDNSLSFTAKVGWEPEHTFDILVSISVPENTSDLLFNIDLPDRNAELNIPFPAPFVLDTRDNVLVAADGSDGHIYNMDIKEFPGASMGLRNLSWYPADRLDMPWVGMCDASNGIGYAMIIDTPDDGILNCRQYMIDGRKLWAPSMIWTMSMGKFSYPRSLIYRFVSSGGYVSLAKAYRSYAREKGLIKPFTEKVKRNPEIGKLFGAPSVWGLLDLNMAQEAKTIGIDRMLMQRWGDWYQKRCSSEDISAINSLGYLTGEYDNYVDIYPLNPGEEISNNRGLVPDDAVFTSDGNPMNAWWDGTQYTRKRCPSLYPSTVDKILGDLLKTYPFTARFLDVVAAQDLFECYNPKHPISKSQSRKYSAEHFSEAGKHGIVIGGEHGIWWAVPYVDYFEGIMSGGFASWSAAYLQRPKSKDESITNAPGEKLPKWSDYEKWGIGHENRIPLWELVFHDCVSTTWYWGDSNDFLMKAASEVTDKKNAFNILYGNRPMLWSDMEGSWLKDRELFLRTYRNTCKLNEVIADKELISHKFITPDRSVQMTTFSDSTKAIVNFGKEPYKARLHNKNYILPQNGFAVDGPKIRQSMVQVNGRPVTEIRMNGYYFNDKSGIGITLIRKNNNHIRVIIDKQSDKIDIKPSDVAAGWSSTGIRIYRLDKLGNRQGEVKWRNSGKGTITFGPCGDLSAFDIIN